MESPDPSIAMSPEIRDTLRHFQYGHLPKHLQEVSREFAVLAYRVATWAPLDPETAVAVRKLLEAKDAAVRAVHATPTEGSSR